MYFSGPSDRSLATARHSTPSLRPRPRAICSAPELRELVTTLRGLTRYLRHMLHTVRRLSMFAFKPRISSVLTEDALGGRLRSLGGREDHSLGEVSGRSGFASATPISY
jgi:hypothetical protein